MVDNNELTIETAPGIIEGVRGQAGANWKSDYPNSQIIYVIGEGYKIVVKEGLYQYFLDVPDNFMLSDISNSATRIADGKLDDDAEKKARADANITEISEADYNAGFSNPYVVPVPVGIFELEAGTDYKELAKNFSDALEANRGRVTSTLLNDAQYVGELTAMLYETGGDVAKAVANLQLTDTYGQILRRLGVKQSQIDAERLEFVDPLKWEENLSTYKTLFKKTALQQYGVELPDYITDVLAEYTRNGYFTPETAATQLQGLLDPKSGVILDNKILNAVSGQEVPTTKVNETRVKDLMNVYLPKSLQTLDVAEEASNLRNKAGYEQELIAKMKKMRYNFYPMYDEDISWEQIIASKQQTAASILGTDLKSDNPLLDEIIKMNDYSKETKRLREYGLSNGFQKTKNDLVLSMMQGFGKGVIPAASFRG